MQSADTASVRFSFAKIVAIRVPWRSINNYICGPVHPQAKIPVHEHTRDIQGIAGGLMKTKLILLVLATVGVCMSQTNVV
jgi:hypothetical protein